MNSPIKKAAKKMNPEQVSKGAFESLQLNLFQDFLCNTESERNKLSNAIDLWDNSPRFSVSRARMNTLRTAEGFLDSMEIPFQYRGEAFKAVIYPARIKTKDGKRLSFYPSAREELVEHALRKISTEEQSGFFDKNNFRSGVIFTLYALRKELEKQGHSLRYDEIVESLDILSTSIIDIVAINLGEDSEPLARSSYLQSLTMVRRKDYESNPTLKCLAQFHPLVTQSIDRLTYRQFNYQRLMKCRNQLTRWLLNQLVLKFTQAAPLNPFDIRFSTIKRDSCLLEGYKVQRQAVAALDQSWEELKELGVLSSIKKNEQRGSRNKLEEIIYSLTPAREFIAEQKAANLRQKNANVIPR